MRNESDVWMAKTRRESGVLGTGVIEIGSFVMRSWS